MSNIEWTEKTWNPTVGCTEVSPGCTNCYAAKMAWRLQHMTNQQVSKDYAGTVKKLHNGKIVWTGKINLLQHRLQDVIDNKKPTTYFVDSMSDLFHKDVPVEYIDKVYTIMARARWHTFQVLTKRADRMLEWYQSKGTISIIDNYPKDMFPAGWPWLLKNVWVGVSVENQKSANERIPFLLQVPAAVRFLSCEPLIGPVNFRWALWHDYNKDTGKREMINGKPFKVHGELDGIDGIHWVICGGESGSGAIRPMHPDWARTLRDQCKDAGIPFFFKQWGNWSPANDHADGKSYDCVGALSDGKIGSSFDAKEVLVRVGKHDAGRLLDGIIHNEFSKQKYRHCEA